MNSRATDDLRRLAEAAGWRSVLTEQGVDATDDFIAWLAADPRNGEAWSQTQTPWDYLAEHATAPEVMAARRGALKRASQSRSQRFGTPMISRPAATAALAVLVLAGGFGGWFMIKPEVYTTGLGERRTLVLSDNSRVVLDSGTILKVKFRRHARTLDLLQGQARFDVSHDPLRPFSVRARDQTVVAVGTRFNVDMLKSKVLVTLIEGRVQILTEDPKPILALKSSPRSPVVLTAGQQLSVTEQTAGSRLGAEPATRIEKVDVNKTNAWESGQLVFEDEPLSSVTEQVSRYSSDKVRTEGAAGQLRISGVFNAGDVRTFLDTVERALPVSVQPGEDSVIRLKAAS